MQIFCLKSSYNSSLVLQANIYRIYASCVCWPVKPPLVKCWTNKSKLTYKNPIKNPVCILHQHLLNNQRQRHQRCWVAVCQLSGFGLMYKYVIIRLNPYNCCAPLLVNPKLLYTSQDVCVSRKQNTHTFTHTVICVVTTTLVFCYCLYKAELLFLLLIAIVTKNTNIIIYWKNYDLIQ